MHRAVRAAPVRPAPRAGLAAAFVLLLDAWPSRCMPAVSMRMHLRALRRRYTKLYMPHERTELCCTLKQWQH